MLFNRGLADFCPWLTAAIHLELQRSWDADGRLFARYWIKLGLVIFYKLRWWIYSWRYFVEIYKVHKGLSLFV